MDILVAIINGIRVFFGFLLVFLIPGFLITLVFFPRPSELRIIERLVYSVIMSMGSVMAWILFMDIILGIDTTPANIIIALTVFCIIVFLLWRIRCLFLTYSITENISGLMNKKMRPVIRNIQEQIYAQWKK